jgi:hypothetical protein
MPLVLRHTTSHTSGKYYLEITANAIDSASGYMSGFMNSSGPLTSYSGSDANSIGI